MADVTAPTNPQVAGYGFEVVLPLTAAAALTAGNSAHVNSSGYWAKADADADATGSGAGVVLKTTAAGRMVDVCVYGPVEGFSDLTAGTHYYSSGTAGGICPLADLADGQYPCYLGTAISTTCLFVGLLRPPDALQDTYIAEPASVAQGDVLYYTGTAWARLAAGTDEQVLITQGASANPTWIFAITTGYPASQAQGDIFFRGASLLERLAAGTANQALLTGGAAADPSWGDVVLDPGSAAQGDIFFEGAAATERLAAGTAGQALLSGGAAADVAWGDVILDPGSAAQGDILFEGAAATERLAAGTKGYMLMTGGAAADASWAAPVTRADVGPLADQDAGATVTVKLGDVPTGRVWVLRRLQVLSGTTADATAQVKIGGSGAHNAASLDGNTEVTSFPTDPSAAAGETVTVDLVTAGGTGDLDAACVILEYYDLPA